ncbi:MAG: demethoxyubiquinone hydroxylase family protein [Alphaproteobacteria bacterium]|nr:MAG: demethoxyubiquinone hydroxylase family protein [Alphaproteobacteria bacterium]
MSDKPSASRPPDSRPRTGAGAPDSATGTACLPGDPDPQARIARILRVDQAGEYGARRIYEGQAAVLRRGPAARAIRHMHAQELRHLERFDELLVERRVRPTLLQPLWHVAGFALGAATALMGERAAMACTVAVEEVIDEHYARQAQQLGDDEAPLRETIETFRQDELAHRDAGLAHGAEEAPAYPVLKAAIKAGSRLAIWLSERL